jgi:predicted dehydrogenase
VVGTGFGTRVHVPALRAAGFHVRALVGRDADRTRRRADRVDVEHALVDLDEALSLDGVRAVSIATPPYTHAEIALAAVGAGMHVLCEKPFALDLREAETMLQAAESARVTHLVGHEFRWATDRATIGRAIAEGLIGEPRLVSLVQHVPLVADPDARTPAWWFDEASGGGWLGASGSHVVDQVRAWLGEFSEVSARLSVTSDRSGVAEDSFTIRFRMCSGVEGMLQQTAAAWGPMQGLTRVAGTTGTVWIDGAEAWLADREGARPLDVPADLELPPAPGESDDPRHRFTHLELGPFTRLCEVLRAGVDGEALPDAVPVPTFADGVACMRVLDAVRASSDAGGATVPV